MSMLKITEINNSRAIDFLPVNFITNMLWSDIIIPI